MTQQINLIGKNSYSAIVKEITEKIQKAEASTLTGNELLKEVYAQLNESITPLLTLKPFVTGAEKIAGDDVKLNELLKFLKKSITGNADLNFLINLVKEEHFAELGRLNHPSPQSTVKDIEDYFDKPGSVIEEGIKAGVFDNLKSKLLNKIKSDLQIVKPQVKLNESNAMFANNLVKYSPIGIKFEDVELNKMVILTESGAILFNRDSKTFSNLSESVNVPDNYKFLMNAINSCSYSPENNTFSLNENWDFDLLLKPNGTVSINGKDIPREKVSALLLESVRTYVSDPTKVSNFNKIQYLKDADNFVALMENSDQLIRLDNLQVIKNLNENSFVMYDIDSVFNKNVPNVLMTSSNNSRENFKSYNEMMNLCESVLGSSLNSLFATQIQSEQEKIISNQNKIVKLNEEQKTLNINISKVRKLKTIADDNSPAMEKLNEQEKILLLKLDTNLKDLNECSNEFKLV